MSREPRATSCEPNRRLAIPSHTGTSGIRMLAARGPWLAALTLAACSSMKESYREANNEEMEGRAAPPIEGGTWVGGGEAEFRAARFKVLAFFKPT